MILLVSWVAVVMYYAAMEIYLMTTLNQEKKATDIRERESRDKCSERVVACRSSVQMKSQKKMR